MNTTSSARVHRDFVKFRENAFLLFFRLKGALRKGPKLLGPKRRLPKTRFVTKICFFFRGCMNETVPKNVEMVCERATWKTWKGTKSNFPRGSTELVLWLHAEGSNSDLTLWAWKEERYIGFIVFWRHEAVLEICRCLGRDHLSLS